MFGVSCTSGPDVDDLWSRAAARGGRHQEADGELHV